MLSYTFTDDGVHVTIINNGVTQDVVSKDNKKYKPMMEAIKNNDEAECIRIINDKMEDVDISILNDCGVEQVENTRLHAYIAKYGVTPNLKAFVDKMKQIDSYRTRNTVYTFVENENIQLTTDGDLLCYKYVNVDNEGVRYSTHVNNLTLLQGQEYKGFVRYQVGDVVECPRREVDDNINDSCSRGLHVGGLQYIRGHDNTIIVKVDPRDVVCIPVGESDKVRCCKLEVMSVYATKLNLTPTHDYSSDMNTAYSSGDVYDFEHGDKITLAYNKFDNGWNNETEDVYFDKALNGYLYYYDDYGDVSRVDLNDITHIALYDGCDDCECECDCDEY